MGPPGVTVPPVSGHVYHVRKKFGTATGAIQDKTHRSWLVGVPEAVPFFAQVMLFILGCG